MSNEKSLKEFKQINCVICYTAFQDQWLNIRNRQHVKIIHTEVIRNTKIVLGGSSKEKTRVLHISSSICLGPPFFQYLQGWVPFCDLYSSLNFHLLEKHFLIPQSKIATSLLLNCPSQLFVYIYLALYFIQIFILLIFFLCWDLNSTREGLLCEFYNCVPSSGIGPCISNS